MDEWTDRWMDWERGDSSKLIKLTIDILYILNCFYFFLYHFVFIISFILIYDPIPQTYFIFHCSAFSPLFLLTLQSHYPLPLKHARAHTFDFTWHIIKLKRKCSIQSPGAVCVPLHLWLRIRERSETLSTNSDVEVDGWLWRTAYVLSGSSRPLLSDHIEARSWRVRTGENGWRCRLGCSLGKVPRTFHHSVSTMDGNLWNAWQASGIFCLFAQVLVLLVCPMVLLKLDADRFHFVLISVW